MAQIARAVAPGIPHHVTQRGNRRQQTFFNDEDWYPCKNEAIAGNRGLPKNLWVKNINTQF